MPAFSGNAIIVYLIAGAVGETIGSAVRSPAESIKSRVQAGIDSSTGEAFQNVILKEEGRSNVIRAWSISLTRDVPFGAIQLAIFESLKSYLIDSTVFDSTLVESLYAEVRP